MLYQKPFDTIGVVGGTYQRKDIFTYDGVISVGDHYEFTVDSITGATAGSPIRIRLMNGETQIRNISNNITAKIDILESDITAGIDKIVAFIYASTTTALTQVCTIINPVMYKGDGNFVYSELFEAGVSNAMFSTQNEYSDTLNTCKLLIGFITKSGYISGEGGINVATAKEEVYTSLIPVSQGEGININITWGESNSQWVAIARYDANGTFIDRIPICDNITQSTFDYVYTVDNGVSYITFTFRTYGNAKCKVTKEWSGLYNVIDTAVDESAGAVVEEKIELNRPSNTVRSIAHRGDGIIAPECTAPAYIIARKHGHTIVENDVNVTEDGYYVMWHDASLSKIDPLIDINGYVMYTDSSNYYWYDESNNVLYTWDGSDYVTSLVDVSTLTKCRGWAYSLNSSGGLIGLNLNILKRLDFGAYKGSHFAATQILTFSEWIMLCKQLGLEAYIDTKVTYTPQIITELATIVKRCGMSEKVSFIGVTSTNVIDALREVIPGARCGVLAYPSATNVVTYKNYNIGRGFFFNGDGRSITSAQASAITLGLDAGFEVEVWCTASTLTEEEQFELIRQIVSCGVTGITLDHYRVDEAFSYLLEQF